MTYTDYLKHQQHWLLYYYQRVTSTDYPNPTKHSKVLVSERHNSCPKYLWSSVACHNITFWCEPDSRNRIAVLANSRSTENVLNAEWCKVPFISCINRDFSSNNLSGSIPASIGNLGILTYLWDSLPSYLRGHKTFCAQTYRLHLSWWFQFSIFNTKRGMQYYKWK